MESQRRSRGSLLRVDGEVLYASPGPAGWRARSTRYLKNVDRIRHAKVNPWTPSSISQAQEVAFQEGGTRPGEGSPVQWIVFPSSRAPGPPGGIAVRFMENGALMAALSEMVNGILQGRHEPLHLQSLMDPRGAHAPLPPPEEPQDPVGPPAVVADPATLEVVASRKTVSYRISFFLRPRNDLPDGRRRLGRNPLVRIQDQDPGLGALLEANCFWTRTPPSCRANMASHPPWRHGPYRRCFRDDPTISAAKLTLYQHP